MKNCESEESSEAAGEKHTVNNISLCDGTGQTVENDGTDQTDRIGHPVEEIRKVPKETCHERHTVEKENMGDDHPVVDGDTEGTAMCNHPTDVDKGCRRVGQHDHPVGLVTGIKPVGFVTGMKYDSLAVGVTDDDPDVPGAVSSAPTFT